MTAGEVIDTFAQAAHAPQTTVRLPAPVTEAFQPVLSFLVNSAPLGNTVADAVLADFGIPRSVLIYMNWPTQFDSRQTQAALEGTGISVPPLGAYAGKLWDYWERHLDPDLYRDRTLAGAAKGRLGVIGGASQILEHQIPDEAMRFARRLSGGVSLEKSARGKVVMVTGASSGIGKSAAMKIADAGGIVLLVARTPEKLEATKDQIEAGGGVAHVHRATSPTATTSTGWPRRCSSSTATSTSWSTTRAARSAARSRSRTTGRTTSSGRCSSTTSERSG